MHHIVYILTRAFTLLTVFLDAENFNSDVSGWDVAKVDNMYGSEYLSLFLAFLIIFFSLTRAYNIMTQCLPAPTSSTVT